MALGIYQGLRRQEVADLMAADVDLERNELTVRRSKNRQWRVLKLHPALLQHLPSPLPANGQPLSLNTKGQPWTGDALQRSFGRQVKRLGWSDVSFHTLRHTCASMMAQSGQHTLYEIGKFLGHQTVQTTVRYAHLLPNQVQPRW